jgi:pimeloyl-ACP methyl ester carboxylesterase
MDITDQQMCSPPRQVRVYKSLDPQTEVKYKLILLHGGCFYTGDHTWNHIQAQQYVRILNAQVYVPDFPQDNLNQTHYFLTQLVAEIGHDVPLIVVGTSSGGYHALWLACQDRVSMCFAFCPIADPYARYQYLQSSNHSKKNQMLSQQLGYFKSVEKMRIASEELQNMIIKVPTVIVKVNDDVNVPPDVLVKFLKSQPKIYVKEITSGGHHLCFEDSNELIEIMKISLFVGTLNSKIE